MRRALACVVLLIAGCPPAPARPRPLPALPVDAYEHYLRGRTAFFEGDYQLAVPELEQAMAAAPDEAGIAVAHAQALARLGRHVDARAAIDRVVARFPRSPEAWLAAGELRRRAGDTGAAIAAFRRAVALDDQLAPAYLGLAAAHTEAGRGADAERAFAALVARRPDVAEGHWRVAQAALARGDDATAEPSLRQVRALAPDELEPRRALAALLARRGDVAAAIVEARAAFDRSGADLAVGEDLVWLLLEAGDRRGALDVLGLYDDGSADDRLRVAAMLTAIGAPRRAEAVLASVRDHDGEAGLTRARARLSAGELRGAIAAADAVAAGDPAWAPSQAVAAWAELALGAADAAAKRLAAARARAPGSVELLEVEAERLRRAGALAVARGLWRDAARAQPRSAALALAWSGFERRAGDGARALALAEKVLTATPDDPLVQNLVGYLLVEGGGDLERAGRLLLAARRKAPGDAGVLDSWGWLRRAIGDRAGAARALARAVQIAPLEPELVRHAATVALEAGDATRAGGLLASVLPLPMAPELAAQVRDELARTGVAPCYAATAMKLAWLARLAVGTALVTAACQSTPSKSDCDKLLAHLIDIEVSSGGGDKLPEAMKAEVAKQKQAIKDYAVGQKFLETCTQKTPKKVVACGLAAKNADELAKCDQ